MIKLDYYNTEKTDRKKNKITPPCNITSTPRPVHAEDISYCDL